ncbi:sugar transferase [Rhizobium sp. DKSPLA3]|uniref:Sugar transferase n=1 Tax=Rhizobium quercicola TaxID=2901226 RepID=A0A9X1NSD3_9HYPH|nr:sugar transferase [Rhizobium quercicola]MCD7108408.1 sugar transferase [Rhizobium quercicola]
MSTHPILQRIGRNEARVAGRDAGVRLPMLETILAETLLANDNIPTLSARTRPLKPIQFALKRAMDVSGALAGLIILAPILLLIAILIRLESKGPVFFRQMRTGRNEVPFEILKFRSMYVEQCDHAGVRLTVDGDPRVTRMGRFLRKTSLDEIPQLWNVVVGHMSLVGPRPHVPDMIAGGMNYADLVRGYENRHLVRPGLTGLAQSRGLRGPTTDRDMAIRRILSDVEYIRTFSILLDIRILVRTIINELRGGTGS